MRPRTPQCLLWFYVPPLVNNHNQCRPSTSRWGAPSVVIPLWAENKQDTGHKSTSDGGGGGGGEGGFRHDCLHGVSVCIIVKCKDSNTLCDISKDYAPLRVLICCIDGAYLCCGPEIRYYKTTLCSTFTNALLVLYVGLLGLLPVSSHSASSPAYPPPSPCRSGIGSCTPAYSHPCPQTSLKESKRERQ